MFSIVLDRVGRLVAVVDERLGLRYANAPARLLLAEGATLRLGSGRLWASPPPAHERLRVTVRAATTPGGSGGLVAFGAGKTPGLVRVEPLPADQSGTGDPLALIVGNRPISVSARDLRAVYGLTRREAEVAALLADGLGLGESADRLGRSVNTVKTIARAVYAKLEVCSHAAAAVRIRIDFST